MPDLDATDRRLIAALKQDGRASITTLAGQLSVSRATVQTRLDRLKSTGVIQRFTVDLSHEGSPETIRAVMLVGLQGTLARSVIRKLRTMPEVVDLYTTNGAWDLVAQIETVSLPEFDRVLREVREVDGVSSSETCLLLDRARG